MSRAPADHNGRGQRPKPAPPRRLWQAALALAVKLALLTIVLFFVARALIRRFAAVPWAEIHFAPCFVALALASMVAGYLLTAAVYRMLLASFCPPPDWPRMLAVAWISPMGKYVPGKVASVAGEIWILRRYGVPGPVAAGVILMLQGLAVTLGLTVSVPLTLWQPVSRALPMAWLWCAMLVAAGLICLHPKIFGAVGNFFARRLTRRPLEKLPRLRHYPKLFVLQLVVLGFWGLALWLMARSIADVPIHRIPLLVSGAALAATIGFLAFFAPAGIGVREGILLVILTPVTGPENAAILTVAMRLMQTLVEVLLALAALILLRGLRTTGK